MRSYRVQGLTRDGRMEVRRVMAPTAEEAAHQVASGGLDVLHVTAPFSFSVFSTRTPNLDVGLFCRELAALVSAGVSLIEALETLREQRQHQHHDVAVIGDLIATMREGRSLSEAMKGFPDTFPALLVASVSASEQTGELLIALERYLRYHEQVGALRSKIVSASLYPAALLIAGLAVGIFLLCYLVPRFSDVYSGIQTDLPLASRLLIQWGGWAGNNTFSVLLGVVLFSAILFFGLRQPAVQQRLLIMLQKNQWIGGQVRLMQLTRFYRSLGLLFQGGVPVLKALRMARSLLPLEMQQAVDAAIAQVSRGWSLSAALQEGNLTTPVALRLLGVGERNGQLAEMLEQTATFHDQEVSLSIERFSRLFEPLLMVIIGGVIGGIVVLLYLPIFELAGGLQ